MDDSKTMSGFLDSPRIVKGGKIQGILPNKRFAPVMREIQESNFAGFLYASLCTTACVIEAMKRWCVMRRNVRDGSLLY